MLKQINPQKEKKKSSLPRAVYHQCEWILRDYDRLKELADKAFLVDQVEGAVVFYTGDGSNLIRNCVVKEAQFKIAAIDTALESLPIEYRNAMFYYCIYKDPLPDVASENTWKKWKRVFIQALAEELKLV